MHARPIRVAGHGWLRLTIDWSCELSSIPSSSWPDVGPGSMERGLLIWSDSGESASGYAALTLHPARGSASVARCRCSIGRRGHARVASATVCTGAHARTWSKLRSETVGVLCAQSPGRLSPEQADQLLRCVLSRRRACATRWTRVHAALPLACASVDRTRIGGSRR